MKKFSSGFCELFENGELNTKVSHVLLTDYNEKYNDVFVSKELSRKTLSRKTKALIALAVASAIYRTEEASACYLELGLNDYREPLFSFQPD